MLVLPNPKRLLLGYLLGAAMTSITLGLVIVFSLDGSSSATSSAKHTIDPAIDIVLGLLLLVIAFVVGALLTLPGASYLAGLSNIAKQNASTAGTVALVVGFNVVMLLLLEVPLVGFTIRPEATAVKVTQFSDWLSRNGGRIGLGVAAVLGAALLVRGVVGLT